jgi:ribosomal protein S18 acetylase RimI-like enzyme
VSTPVFSALKTLGWFPGSFQTRNKRLNRGVATVTITAWKGSISRAFLGIVFPTVARWQARLRDDLVYFRSFWTADEPKIFASSQSVLLDLETLDSDLATRCCVETWSSRSMSSIPVGWPPEVLIRPTDPSHAASLCQAVGEVARERRWLAAVEPFSEAETRMFVQLNRAVGVPQFVAVCGMEVIGWCDVVRLYSYPGYEHNGRLGMGVISGWRGRGLGRALLDRALEAAPAAGFRRVELEVYASNTTALRLYRSRGFEVEGVKRAMRILDGQVDDVVCMARSVGEGAVGAV